MPIRRTHRAIRRVASTLAGPPLPNLIARSSPAWWPRRSRQTRSHPELGRQTLQRPWYCASRPGRVGRRQARQDHAMTHHSLSHDHDTARRPTAAGQDAGWSSPVARQAHNLKAAGSNPAPATNTTTHTPTPSPEAESHGAKTRSGAPVYARKTPAVPSVAIQLRRSASSARLMAMACRGSRCRRLCPLICASDCRSGGGWRDGAAAAQFGMPPSTAVRSRRGRAPAKTWRCDRGGLAGPSGHGPTADWIRGRLKEEPDLNVRALAVEQDQPEVAADQSSCTSTAHQSPGRRRG